VDEPNETRFARRVTANFLFWPVDSPFTSRMFDDQTEWATSDVVSTGDVVKDAMRKEQIIKWVRFHVISGLY
jgi:hypothetical protein